MTTQEIAALAQQVLLKDGVHAPTVIVEGTRRATAYTLRSFPRTADGRRAALRAVGERMARSGGLGDLVRVFFISEGWMSLAKSGQIPPMPPSQDPERTEVLIVSGADVAEHALDVVIIEVVRDQAERITHLQKVPGLEGTQVDASPLESFINGFLGHQRKAVA